MKKKLVHITFDDPASLDNWIDIESILEEFDKHKPNEVVGWIIYEDKKHIIVSSHLGGGDLYSGILKVNKGIIIKRKNLDKK